MSFLDIFALLILAVLGSILAGLATPTEAASVGAVGAILLALTRRQFNLNILRGVVRSTMEVSSMVFLILIGASIFSLVFRGLGGDEIVANLLKDLPGGKVGAMIAVIGYLGILVALGAAVKLAIDGIRLARRAEFDARAACAGRSGTGHGAGRRFAAAMARLESLAKAGEIIVGTDTYSQACNYFEFESMNPTSIKGKQQPVKIYRIKSAKKESFKPIGCKAFKLL